MRIHILALNGVFDTGLTAVLDAFGTANALAEMTGVSSLRFQVKMVGLRKIVTTARGLTVPVIAAARAQTPPNHLAHADPLIQQFERWARGRLAQGFSLDQAAEALGTSKRTLARRMESVLGKTPLAFFQDLRIERAVHLLRAGHASVDQIAAEVGYAEGVTLRALLRRKLGRSVREIRRSL